MPLYKPPFEKPGSPAPLCCRSWKLTNHHHCCKSSGAEQPDMSSPSSPLCTLVKLPRQWKLFDSLYGLSVSNFTMKDKIEFSFKLPMSVHVTVPVFSSVFCSFSRFNRKSVVLAIIWRLILYLLMLLSIVCILSIRLLINIHIVTVDKEICSLQFGVLSLH